MMNEVLKPDQLVKEGQAAYRKGDYAGAGRSFLAASHGFHSAGELLGAAEAANNASVALLQAGDAQGALQALEGTEEVFAEAGDFRRQGMAIGNRAAAMEGLNRLDEALEAYEQSADLLKQSGEDNYYANVMQSLSALQLRTGRQLQALASMQSGLEQVQKPTTKQRFLKRLLRIPFRMLDK
jgi:tetratricopeptide (TPR) repeat protein